MDDCPPLKVKKWAFVRISRQYPIIANIITLFKLESQLRFVKILTVRLISIYLFAFNKPVNYLPLL